MPTPQLPTANPDASLAELKDYLVGLNRYLNYLLSSLDTLNISRLDAKVIVANTITAAKMNVTQLSAIAADLGTITAGQIFGAYIATANGTYPRIELSSAGNLLTAFFDATHHIEIVPNYLGTPGITFTTPTASGYLTIGGAMSLTASGIELDLGSTQAVYIKAGTTLTVESSSGVITDIVATVNSKAPKGLAGTKIYYVSDTSGGAVTRKLTFTDGVLTSET